MSALSRFAAPAAPRRRTLHSTSRRGFLKTMPALGGLVLCVGAVGPVQAADEAPKFGADGMPNGWRDDPKTFVAIGADGIVTVTIHRSEMGQGVRTSLPRVVADELEADWKRVRVLQAPGDEPRFGNQDTDGSRSMRHWFEPMRRCGASARTMLEQAAAARWKVPLAEVQARYHQVVHAKTGRALGYGALALAAARLDVPARDSVKLKDPAAFRYIGKRTTELVDGPDIVTGKAQYGIDTRLPGMLYAVVARPPVLGGKVKRFDAEAAMKVAGVVKVVEIAGTPPPSEFQPVGGVAVIAKDTWAAIQGRNALKVEWDDGPHGSYDSEAFRAELEAAVSKPGKEVRNEGDVAAALAKAARKVEATYYVPHLAHATMEPPAAAALVKDGHCTVWAPIQSPQAARDRVAERLNLGADKVEVKVTLLGGGFGRKSKPDFCVEAALLAQAMPGTPIKLTWTREDDLHHDYMHAVSAQRLEAGLDAQNKVTAWLQRAAEPTIISIFAPDPKHLAPFELGLGLVGMPFAVPNVRIENAAAEAHARIGWLRSVNNIQHAFAAQSFVAELALAAGRDHKEFLLELLGADRKIDPTKLKDEFNHGESPQRYPLDTARLRGVVERVTKEAGWGRKLPANQGLGLAAHYSFVSYLAAVVEVAFDAKGELTIPRVDIAIDCGPQINPDRIESQLEGACVMAVSQALLGEITYKNGRVQQDNLHQFELLRMNAAPKLIKVHLMPPPSYDAPLGGVGEPGIPVIAPALANAVQAATGKRVRSLPMRSSLVQI